jgi:hypothetical protein
MAKYGSGAVGWQSWRLADEEHHDECFKDLSPRDWHRSYPSYPLPRRVMRAFMSQCKDKIDWATPS